MHSKIKIALSITVLGSILLLSGCLKASDQKYAVNLEIWGVFDDSDSYTGILSEFRMINPYIREIKFRKMDINTYRKDLLNAMAAGQGPDIFMIQNNWLPAFKDKIVSAPEWITGEKEFRDQFADVAADDFLDNGQVYGVPLSIDSLALYYNKDFLNAEGIAKPPVTWDELAADVKKLTKVDSYGNIVQQGVAMGTAYNINRSTDVLGLLMMQQGSEMFDKQYKTVTFDQSIMIDGKSVNAGEKAMDFYTQFARSDSPFYAWNPRSHYSIDAFYEGSVAMMLNYSWHAATIENKNAKLNFAVAPVPQFNVAKPVDYSNYWGYVVAKNKLSQSQSGTATTPVSNEVRMSEAWEFLKSMTYGSNGKFRIMNSVEFMNCLAKKEKNCLANYAKEVAIKIDPAADYLEKTSKPAARRDLLEKQMKDPFLGVFAYGNLIAKSWYQEDSDAIETALAEAIDSVNNGMETSSQALTSAANKINKLIKR